MIGGSIVAKETSLTRRIVFLNVAGLLALVSVAAIAPATAEAGRAKPDVKVMSRNLYLGVEAPVGAGFKPSPGGPTRF